MIYTLLALSLLLAAPDTPAATFDSTDTELITAVLLAEGADVEEAAQLLQRAEQIQRDVLPRLRGSDTRKARAIFRTLHRDHLPRYEDDATLRQTLSDGTYNCLSAITLFYSLANRADIPLQLMASPNHVFAYLDEGGKRTRIEITDPRNGFGFTRDQKKAVDYLLRYKMVTPAEVTALGIEEIYHSYFEDAKPVSARHLVAFSYGNRAIRLIETEPLESVRSAAEALSIDPDDESLCLIYQLSILSLADGPAAEFRDSVTDALGQWQHDDEMRGLLLPMFSEIIEQESIQEKAFGTALDRLEQLGRIAVDADLVEELGGVSKRLRFNQALHFSQRGEHEDAFRLMDQLRVEHPEDPRVNETYAAMGRGQIGRLLQHGDFATALAVADSVYYHVPDLPAATDLYVFTVLAYAATVGNEEEELDRVLNVLLRAHERAPMNIYVRAAAAQAYHHIAMAEIRARNYARALELLDDGLAIDPDNRHLLSSREQTSALIR